MKKTLILIIFILSLNACSKPVVDETSILKTIDNYQTFIFKQNYRYSNYSFYLPSDCSIKEYKDDLFDIKYLDYNISLGFNIANLIQNNFFNQDQKVDVDDILSEQKLFFTHKSKALNINKNEYDYNLNIYNYDNKFIISFITDSIVVYSLCDFLYLNDIIGKIIIIANSFEIDEKQLIAKYSNKQIIDYTRQQVSLFGSYTSISTDGNLSDLINGITTTQEENITQTLEEGQNDNAQLDD